MGSLVQFQHFVLDKKAVQKLTPSLELFFKPAGRKMPLATITPVQMYYFCSNEYKNSLLNKLSYIYAIFQRKRQALLFPAIHTVLKWQIIIHCCYCLKRGTGLFTSASEGTPL